MNSTDANLIRSWFQVTHGDIMDPFTLKKYMHLLEDLQQREMLMDSCSSDIHVRELLRKPVAMA